MTPCFVHIDLDAFFAEAERLRNPTLRGRPVIVGGNPDQRGVVHSGTYEARRDGVTTGMSLSRARRLCPRAAFVKGSYPLYAALSRRLFEIVTSATPDVTKVGIDEATVDFDGIRRHWPSPRAFAGALARRVRDELGLAASVGIATSQTLARVACARGKPSGLVEIPPGEERAFLDPLPIQRLPGVGGTTARELGRFNIQTVTDLRALDRPLLIRLFGEARGTEIYECARGRDVDSGSTRPHRPRTISRETAFEHDTAERTLILGTLHYLVERAGMRLRRLGMAAGGLEVRFRHGGGEQLRARECFAQPRIDDRSFFRAARTLFLARYDHRRPLHRIGLTLTRLTEGWEQALLFPRAEEDRARRLSRSVDHVRARFGFRALTQGRSIDLISRLEREETDDGGFRLHNPALTQ